MTISGVQIHHPRKSKSNRNPVRLLNWICTPLMTINLFQGRPLRVHKYSFVSPQFLENLGANLCVTPSLAFISRHFWPKVVKFVSPWVFTMVVPVFISTKSRCATNRYNGLYRLMTITFKSSFSPVEDLTWNNLHEDCKINAKGMTSAVDWKN